MVEATIGAIVFLVVGLPIMGVIGLRAYWMWLRDKLLQRLLEERRILIEQGITDLPPLQLPETALANGDAEVPSGSTPAIVNAGFRSIALWVSLTLLFVAVCLSLLPIALVPPDSSTLLIPAFALALAGLLLLVIRSFVPTRVSATRRTYARLEEPTQQPLAVAYITDRLRNLKRGIVLLFVSAAFVSWEFLTPPLAPGYRPQLLIAIFLGALGLALLVIHTLESYTKRREEQEPPA